MVLVARETALTVVPEHNCFPLVCDLAAADDLKIFSVTRHPSLCHVFRHDAEFRASGNSAEAGGAGSSGGFSADQRKSGARRHYAAGMRRILPQYDNDLTREWLMMFLLDLGVEKSDGELRFAIETGGFGLKRVVARFHFSRARQIKLDGESFKFRRGESIRLFLLVSPHAGAGPQSSRKA